MTRSLKNYLCGTALAALIWFTGVTFLAAQELRNRTERIEQSEDVRISTGWYSLIAAEGVLIFLDGFYLIASKGNRLSFKETMESVPMRFVAGGSGVVGGCFTTMLAVSLIGEMPEMEMPRLSLPQEQITVKNDDSSETQEEAFPVPELPPVLPVKNLADQASAVLSVEGEQTVPKTVSSDESGKSAVLVLPGSQASVVQTAITKTGEDSSFEDVFDYGLNSGVFVRENAAANILESRISTGSDGSPGVAANGTDSLVTMSDSTVTTTGNYSPAVLSLFKAGITLKNDQLSTSANQSAVLQTGSNGSIEMTSGNISTSGVQSMLLRGSGSFKLDNVYGTASSSQVAALDAGSQTEMNSCTFQASGMDTQDTEGAFYLNGFSESEKAQKTVLSMTGCSVSALMNTDGSIPIPLFHTYLGDMEINLSGCAFRTASGLFAFQQAGHVVFNLDRQNIYGASILDAAATTEINLKNGSSYTGGINSENTGAKVSVSLDASSTLTLTSDMYLDSFEDADSSHSNVVTNGFTIYVKGEPAF